MQKRFEDDVDEYDDFDDPDDDIDEYMGEDEMYAAA